MRPTWVLRSPQRRPVSFSVVNCRTTSPSSPVKPSLRTGLLFAHRLVACKNGKVAVNGSRLPCDRCHFADHTDNANAVLALWHARPHDTDGAVFEHKDEILAVIRQLGSGWCYHLLVGSTAGLFTPSWPRIVPYLERND